MSDRVVRFSEASWQEVEALPEPLRWTVQRAIFHLLDEPVPTLADPFPKDGGELGYRVGVRIALAAVGGLPARHGDPQ